jgi:hypothetical protein
MPMLDDELVSVVRALSVCYLGRLGIIGFSMPEEKPESITFEIQINPPDGEKKMVTWEER